MDPYPPTTGSPKIPPPLIHSQTPPPKDPAPIPFPETMPATADQIPPPDEPATNTHPAPADENLPTPCPPANSAQTDCQLQLIQSQQTHYFIPPQKKLHSSQQTHIQAIRGPVKDNGPLVRQAPTPASNHPRPMVSLKSFAIAPPLTQQRQPLPAKPPAPDPAPRPSQS